MDTVGRFDNGERADAISALWVRTLQRRFEVAGVDPRTTLAEVRPVLDATDWCAEGQACATDLERAVLVDLDRYMRDFGERLRVGLAGVPGTMPFVEAFRIAMDR